MQLYTKILIGMLTGVALGLAVGPSSAWLPQTGVVAPARLVTSTEAGRNPVPQAAGLKSARIVEQRDSPAALRIEWQLSPQAVARLHAQGVAATADQSYTGWVRPNDPGVRRYAPIGQSLVNATEWLGRLFVALIKMVVVPLVFFSLVVGIAGLGDPRKLGKLGGLTLLYFTATTVLALLIGLGVSNVVRPGHLLALSDREALLAGFESDASAAVARLGDTPSLVDQLLTIVPGNPFAALAEGDMLAVIFFALLLGVALTLMPSERARPAVAVCDSLNEAMITIVGLVMKLAPVGVAALLFEVVGTTGLSVLGALAVYAIVVLVGLALHVTLVYGLVIRLLVRLPFLGFLRALRAPLLLAFSTSSSSATLPVSKHTCEKNLGASAEVTSLVLPLGATVNMDGTALYQGVAAVFIAQIYGMDLSLAEQATVVVSATLASVGAAGVPGAGMITLAMVLTTVGVPAEGVALIVGVDRLLDMFRTTTNVIGDCTATALVARVRGDSLRTVGD